MTKLLAPGTNTSYATFRFQKVTPKISSKSESTLQLKRRFLGTDRALEAPLMGEFLASGGHALDAFHCGKTCHEFRRLRQAIFLSRSFFAASHSTLLVIVLNNVNGAALLWIALDDRKGPIRPEGLDHFGPSIKVVVTDLAHHYAMRVFLHEVDFAVEVSVALDSNQLVVVERPDYVGLAIAIGIDSKLIFVRTDSIHPLIGVAIGVSMSDDRALRFRAGSSNER
jgi:hypothetical protein